LESARRQTSWAGGKPSPFGRESDRFGGELTPTDGKPVPAEREISRTGRREKDLLPPRPLLEEQDGGQGLAMDFLRPEQRRHLLGERQPPFSLTKL
jgi:hypothetical protein